MWIQTGHFQDTNSLEILFTRIWTRFRAFGSVKLAILANQISLRSLVQNFAGQNGHFVILFLILTEAPQSQIYRNFSP